MVYVTCQIYLIKYSAQSIRKWMQEVAAILTAYGMVKACLKLYEINLYTQKDIYLSER